MVVEKKKSNMGLIFFEIAEMYLTAQFYISFIFLSF